MLDVFDFSITFEELGTNYIYSAPFAFCWTIWLQVFVMGKIVVTLCVISAETLLSTAYSAE